MDPNKAMHIPREPPEADETVDDDESYGPTFVRRAAPVLKPSTVPPLRAVEPDSPRADGDHVHAALGLYQMGWIRWGDLFKTVRQHGASEMDRCATGALTVKGFMAGVYDQDWLDEHRANWVTKYSRESVVAAWNASGGSAPILRYQMGASAFGRDNVRHRSYAGQDDNIRAAQRYYNDGRTPVNLEHASECIMDMFQIMRPHPPGLILYRGLRGEVADLIMDAKDHCRSILMHHTTMLSATPWIAKAGHYAKAGGVILVMRTGPGGIATLPYMEYAYGNTCQMETLLPPGTVVLIYPNTLRRCSFRSMVDCVAYTPGCADHAAAYARMANARVLMQNAYGVTVCEETVAGGHGYPGASLLDLHPATVVDGLVDQFEANLARMFGSEG